MAIDVASELRALTGDDSVQPAAVVVNITVTESIGDGYLTAWGAGERPTASTLNYATGENVANGATVPVDAETGYIHAYASAQTHLIVDIMGFYAASTGFVSITPTRVADSRDGVGFDSLLAGGEEYSLDVVAGLEGVEAADDAYAVLLNLTTVGAAGAGYLTVWPADATTPESSNVNFHDTSPVANNAMVQLGADGTINVYTHGEAYIVLDIFGHQPGGDEPTEEPTPTPTEEPTGDPTGETDPGTDPMSDV